MLQKLREKNQELLKQYEAAGDAKNIIIQKTIANLLSHDDCFFKISIEHSYTMLRELQVKPEKYEQIYLILTKPKD